MDQQQVRWALFKFSMVAVGASTWIFMSFIFATRPEEQSVSADPLVHLVRLPASLPGVPAQLPRLLTGEIKPAEPIRMEVMKLPCWDMADMADQPVDARWIRFTGRPCQSKVDAEMIEFRNNTNGYSGTVFTAQKNLFTTDFIPLEKGANEILVRVAQEDGLAFENRFVLVKAGVD